MSLLVTTININKSAPLPAPITHNSPKINVPAPRIEAVQSTHSLVQDGTNRTPTTSDALSCFGLCGCLSVCPRWRYGFAEPSTVAFMATWWVGAGTSVMHGHSEGVQCGLCPRVERSGRRPKRYVIEARRVETGRLHGLARCAARKHGPKRSAGERPVPGSAERRQSWKPGIRALAKAV